MRLSLLLPLFLCLVASCERPGRPPPPDVTDSATYATATRALGDIRPGQYVARNCAEADIPDPAYDGFDVRRCVYEAGGLTGVVYVLNPDAKDVALWVANACRSVGRPEDESCARRLVEHMRNSNSFIFPVAGDVLEPASSTGCSRSLGRRMVHVYFRDGVTIQSERGFYCRTGPIPVAEADAEAFRPPAKVYNIARVAALHRQDYARAMGVPVPTDDAWRRIVRDSHLRALRTGTNPLLNIVARMKYL